MIKPRCCGVLCLVVLALFTALSNSVTALGQGSNPPATAQPKRDKINYEVQLHLLVNSNEASEKANLPQSLDSVVRQLKPLLPFANYRLATTFVNRVRDGGDLQTSGVVGSDYLFTKGTTNPSSPTFYEFTLSRVTLDTGGAEQSSIDIPKFRFGLRLPVITGTARAEGNNAAYPIINYEPTGITTEMSLREGTPTVVGTMNTSRADQILILVISVKRTQ